MSYQFDPDTGLVIVYSEVFGPSGSIVLRLALDTGATGTMINCPAYNRGIRSFPRSRPRTSYNWKRS